MNKWCTNFKELKLRTSNQQQQKKHQETKHGKKLTHLKKKKKNTKKLFIIKLSKYTDSTNNRLTAVIKSANI